MQNTGTGLGLAIVRKYAHYIMHALPSALANPKPALCFVSCDNRPTLAKAVGGGWHRLMPAYIQVPKLTEQRFSRQMAKYSCLNSSFSSTSFAVPSKTT